MKNSRMRWMLAGASATVLAASSVGAQGIPVQKEGPGVRTTQSTISMGDVAMTEDAARVMRNDLALVNGMTDPQIMHFLITGDSMEVAFSNLAATKGTSAALRSLAQTISADHAASLAEGREMAVDEDIGRQPTAGMMGDAHMAKVHARLAGMAAGDAWDREWLHHQVMHHRHTLAMLNAAEPRARDDDLEQKIDELRPVVQRHLDSLLSLASAMGMNMSAHTGH